MVQLKKHTKKKTMEMHGVLSCRGQNSEAPLSFLRRGLEESLYQQSTAKQGALARPWHGLGPRKDVKTFFVCKELYGFV